LASYNQPVDNQPQKNALQNHLDLNYKAAFNFFLFRPL
jgi:hypothetical protein